MESALHVKNTARRKADGAWGEQGVQWDNWGVGRWGER